MDSLSFLYWSLAGGFLVLVFFISMAIIQIIRILRDFADASDSVKDAAEKMNENVSKIAERVTETADQIGEYVVKPLTMVKFLSDKVGPVLEMVKQKGEEWQKGMEGDSGEDETPKKQPKKRRFGRKKA